MEIFCSVGKNYTDSNVWTLGGIEVHPFKISISLKFTHLFWSSRENACVHLNFEIYKMFLKFTWNDCLQSDFHTCIYFNDLWGFFVEWTSFTRSFWNFYFLILNTISYVFVFLLLFESVSYLCFVFVFTFWHSLLFFCLCISLFFKIVLTRFF